jgi:hypothetical protein
VSTISAPVLLTGLAPAHAVQADPDINGRAPGRPVAPGQTLVNTLALVRADPGYQLSLTGAICSAERVLTVLTFAQNEL